MAAATETAIQVKTEAVDPSELAESIIAHIQLLRDSGALKNSWAPLLPLLFQAKGKPVTMDNHLPMLPLYESNLPKETLMICGRQVGKSFGISGGGIIRAMVEPEYRILYVLPRFDQARRLSANYVKPLLTGSPVRNLMINSQCENSVLQKTLPNGSRLHFSYAFLDCDRCRGLSVDEVNYDEVQDLDSSFIDVINETMSASEWRTIRYTGTPKSLDNTIEGLRQRSSMAELVVRCGCGHWCIPSTEYDGFGMMGSMDHFKEHGTGLKCPACSRPVRIEDGEWLHRRPDLAKSFPSHHAPQTIMPIHHYREDRWFELLKKHKEYPPSKFMNEVLGESCDLGRKLVTMTELMRAAVLPWNNTYDSAMAVDFKRRYSMRVMGVDWGGGGEKGLSSTSVAIYGLTGDRRVELLYGEKLHQAVDDIDEVRRVLRLYNDFRCHNLAHDFNGIGRAKETLLLQGGFPFKEVSPMTYISTAGKTLIAYHRPSPGSNRWYYTLDKTWSLMMFCLMIKTNYILFPRWESSKDFLEDFLHIHAETSERSQGPDLLRVMRVANQSDDNAHSSNYSVQALLKLNDYYPNTSHGLGISLSDDERFNIHPVEEVKLDWDNPMDVVIPH